jgi:histidine triad (HIT) family protein/ATP adenylyltransferase
VGDARVPFDTDAYVAQVQADARRGVCFICDIVAGRRDDHCVIASDQGNAHVHWHLAPLPPGVPYEQQQYAALMAENGVIELSAEEESTIAARIGQFMTCPE